jgi:hypothetical protein
MKCLVCGYSEIEVFCNIENVNYFECFGCDSIFADQKFIRNLESNIQHYNNQYWESEIQAAKERSFGSSVNRVCEVFLYSRVPIKRFIDIGTGPGYLLDALSVIMPDYSQLFFGCEKFPPPSQFRTQHENYVIGDVSDSTEKYSAGVCIEVIEHLSPTILCGLVEQLSKIVENQAIFYFNSAQPRFIKNTDPNYLDPFNRGHIVSYSLKGLKKIFADFDFTLIELPGRDWGFLAEYKSSGNLLDTEGLLTRLWTAIPENIDILKNNGFGHLAYTIGLESARCYLEHALNVERTAWAKSLEKSIKSKSLLNYLC